jgi:peptide/nickel transport system permease protein
MISFLGRRLASAVPTAVGITVLAFLILNLLPGDPLLTWSPGGVAPTAEALERLRAGLGAGRGPVERYVDWASALLRGDLGRSLIDGRPVLRIVADSLPWTALLSLSALAAIFGLAVPFGLFGAAARGSAADRLGGWILIVLYALPPFAAALLFQELLAVRLGILPLQGTTSAVVASSVLGRTGDLLRHLALPTACLALSGWAFVARYSRATFRAVLGREFLSVARAKGLSRLRAYGHVAATAAVPFVTLLASVLPGLVGGSPIVEEVFSWPGLGRLYLASVERRDYPVVLGLTLLAALIVLAGQIITDLLYLLVDPRMRDTLLGEKRDA